MSVQSTDPAASQRFIDAQINGSARARTKVYRFPFSERRLLLIFADALLVMVAVCGALWLKQKADGRLLTLEYLRESWVWFLVALVFWGLLSRLNDLYDIPTSYRRTLTAVRVGVVAFLIFAAYLVVYFLTSEALPRRLVIYFLALLVPMITVWRWIYSIVFSAPPFHHRVLIVGANKRGRLIADALKKEPMTNYKVIGFLDDDPDVVNETVDNTPVLDLSTSLLYLVSELKIQEIVVASEDTLERELFLRLVECQAQGVEISWMPDLYEKVLRRVPIQHIDPVWALHAIQGQPLHNRGQLVAKRLLDLTVLLFALPVMLVFIPLIALAIYLDSPGPPLYRQTRCGQGGKPFKMIKFRTMCLGAEKDGEERWASKNDPRVTRMGRFLRKSRLDELPQLFNVLRGEMSIVGPRPERPNFVKKLEKEINYYPTRLAVKPGITGWAQIHYDYGNSVEDALMKLQYDFYYIHYLSIVLDVYIMFRTVGVMFRLRGT